MNQRWSGTERGGGSEAEWRCPRQRSRETQRRGQTGRTEDGRRGNVNITHITLHFLEHFNSHSLRIFIYKYITLYNCVLKNIA